MTIQLKPETEALLVRAAARESRDPSELADVLISESLRWDDDPVETKLILERLKEAEAGRERPAADFFREHRERYPEPSE